jgi:hypothetical protein
MVSVKTAASGQRFISMRSSRHTTAGSAPRCCCCTHNSCCFTTLRRQNSFKEHLATTGRPTSHSWLIICGKQRRAQFTNSILPLSLNWRKPSLSLVTWRRVSRSSWGNFPTLAVSQAWEMYCINVHGLLAHSPCINNVKMVYFSNEKNRTFIL